MPSRALIRLTLVLILLFSPAAHALQVTPKPPVAPAAKPAPAHAQADDDDDKPDADSPAPDPPAPDPDDKHEKPRPFTPIQAPAFGDRLDLTPTWLFKRGPAPAPNAYAAPTLDDSSWITVDTTQPIVLAGELNLNEVWYRSHVHLSPGSHGLALTLTNIGGSYRVFVNGRELGGHGLMGGRGEFLVFRSSTYAIPDDLLRTGDLTITLHCFVGAIDRAALTLKDGINRTSTIYLGPGSVLARDEQAYNAQTHTISGYILTLWAVVFILSLALAVLIRRDSEARAYPFLAVLSGSYLAYNLLNDYSSRHFYSATSWLAWPVEITLAAAGIAALEFFRIVAASQHRRRWLKLVEGTYLIALISLAAAAAGWISFFVHIVLLRVADSLIVFTVVVYLIKGLRRRQRDAIILIATLGVYLAYLLVWSLLTFLHPNNATLDNVAQGFVHSFTPGEMRDLATIVGLLVLLIVRTLRIVRERAAIATEIEAARTMQQLLLARSNQPTPGFLIETTYLPAGEVGGDFFLVTLNPDHSLTAVLGDVSGKGLRAAMRVSMILGVLRREPSQNPADILFSLNEALHADHELGFTTACCVRIAASGAYELANAGHISPYISGQEIVTPPALPLGLAPDQTYELATGKLRPGQRIVLMSDGVVEARNNKGKLLGFERLAPLTLKPAAEIAQTAQTFGQDDDITVLTIAPAPAAPIAPPPPPPR